jgi:hypothetical protein
MNPARIILLIALTATGCQLGGRRQEVRIVDPVLPESIGRIELVEYLNGKTAGLQSWRCMNTQVHVRSPDLMIAQKLKGTLACSAPGQFRLVCDNTVGHADFGSNENICWAYVKPGKSVVMTWKHEDSALLQHLPGGLPRLEPEWLMTVLGVEPLDADRYDLQHAPMGSKEVWLVAIEDAPDGSSLRRVIKVDTVQGVIRRHALYDSDAQPLLIADLSDYKSCGKHELPHTVRIDFPKTETQLTLKFSGIETGYQMAEALWQPPRNVEVMDLGDYVRLQMQHDPQFAPRGRSDSAANADPGVKTAFNSANHGTAKGNADSDSEPSFDDEPSFDTQSPNLHLAGNEKFYSPDGDDSFNDQFSGQNQTSEEDWERALTEESLVPEFDVVAPRSPSRGKKHWFQFWKK